MITNKVIGGAAGGMLGGFIFWLVAEVLVYQMIEKKQEQLFFKESVEYDNTSKLYSEENTDTEIVLLKGAKSKGTVPQTNYVEKFKKGKLEGLEVHMVSDEEPQKKKIEVISEAEYQSNEDDYEQLSLSFYTEDDVVTDLADKQIKQFNLLIGFDALDRFGEKTSDPDVVYVKNEADMTMYEVIRIHGSYDNIILGMPKVKKAKKKVKPENDEDDNE